jgi:plasmid stabilization system protein ParE
MKLSWTPTAINTYFKVLDYLEENWTKKEVQNYGDKVEKVLSRISENPEMFEASKKKKNIRKGFITSYNALYYRVKPNKKELELLTFWDNRQNPKKLMH